MATITLPHDHPFRTAYDTMLQARAVVDILNTRNKPDDIREETMALLQLALATLIDSALASVMEAAYV